MNNDFCAGHTATAGSLQIRNYFQRDRMEILKCFVCFLIQPLIMEESNLNISKSDIALSQNTMFGKFSLVLNRIIKRLQGGKESLEWAVGCDYYLSIAAVGCPIPTVYWCGVVCAECCRVLLLQILLSVQYIWCGDEGMGWGIQGLR